ncbi:DoxX family protein [Antrihabitans sp. YC2-6]|uniref:DoxX family protein n=1 Tax=Antrihabitans sp. YC2-6 TaxID=2799498 RepID=UPI0018F3ED6A|nr:DoxX family protein [Antrihabitans sp. YC2-6]MBJ8343424.1 DoxX family protein [Antrihabitans sp. YC2-6]
MTEKPENQSGATDAAARPATGRSAGSPYDSPTEEIAVGRTTVPRTDEDLSIDATSQLPTYRPNLGKPVEQPAYVPTPMEMEDDGPPQKYAFEPEHTVPPAATAGTGARAGARKRARAIEDDTKGRGTLDLGLLILRLTVGGIFLFHALQKLTGWWNGPGLDGVEKGLSSGGWDQPKLMSILLTVGELGGSILLILGLATPLAAGAVLAIIIDAWLVKQAGTPGLQFSGDQGVELETLLLGASAGLILTGPGRIALDGRRGWATRPAAGSLLVLVAAIIAAACTWVFLHGGNPFI